ncbi:hypothetical protein CQA66_06410 [Helicobacter aurati]|uniref:Uncharacterized protein n=1 Tax=Helicobacter aurati TaxID=137778 RepID=A0A3D8J232_9HELI|nr:hypothetical protein CQA66_06410 [Helicobacter aurati]
MHFLDAQISLLQEKIRSFIAPKTYQSNAIFIQKLFKNEKSFYKDDNINVIKVLNTLKANGLLTLKLAKPNNITISFRINAKTYTDSNPSFMFLAYTTSNLLSNMGYSYFYVTHAKKNHDSLSISYTLNAESEIDPTVLIGNIQKRGYNIVDVIRDSPTHWIYVIRLEQSKITHAQQITKGTSQLNQVSGKYWITLGIAGVLQVTLDNDEKWNPKILIFDDNMNLLEAIMSKDMQKQYTLKTNVAMRFLMITDNYNPANLRNGITLTFTPNKSE